MSFDWMMILFMAQVFATAFVLIRLLPGRHRRPPLQYVKGDADGSFKGLLTVVIPARNEEKRIKNCLLGLATQGDEVAEILVVDDQSSDRTAEVALSIPDARIRVVRGRSLPRDWVGKAWALEQGMRAAKTEWVLCLDADTEPAPGLAYSVLRAALDEQADLLFVAPRFLVDGAGQRWLHPSLMTTLIYRLGPGDSFALSRENGKKKSTKRQMISGPCFVYRREVLQKNGGFYPARGAFAEDAVMAAHLSGRGLKVAFRDGAPLLRARMYESLHGTWKGWGVSLALNEVTPMRLQIVDLFTLILTQAAPLPVLISLTANFSSLGGLAWPFLTLNGFLFLIRVAILRATAGSYEPARGVYWLSPLADILAVMRILLSAASPPRSWRGRVYRRR